MMSLGALLSFLYTYIIFVSSTNVLAFKTTFESNNNNNKSSYILATRTQNQVYTNKLLPQELAKMASSHANTLPNEEEPPHSTLIFRPAGRRTPSFSSLSPSSSWDSSFRSSSFSYNEEFPPFSPSSPLKFKGVPFSWEQIPGIPKHQGSKKKGSSDHLLPLPPAGTTTSSATKKLLQQKEISPKKSRRFQKDPFLAALVECSKDNDENDDDDDDHGNGANYGNILKGSSKITRTLSDRFGLINMYTSCKRTCAVSESIVYLPRQSSHYLLNRRSS